MTTGARTYVLTGSASGIGAAARSYLEERGARVVGVDLQDAEVIADLETPVGRQNMVEAVADLTNASVDAVIACAGGGGPSPKAVKLSYFGAVATLSGLHPLLVRGRDPRALAISSVSSVHETSPEIVEACLVGDEVAAEAAAQGKGALIYASAKAALCRWVRRTAPLPEWAGRGVALNAIAPGVVKTPATARVRASEKGRAIFDEMVPMPFGGWMDPTDIAPYIAFFTAPENREVTGQVLFVDRGADAVLRRDRVW